MSTIKGLDKAPSFFSMNDTFCNKRNIRNGFSSRIWINKEKLINTLNSEIRDEIIRRADYRQMSKIIQNRLGVGANDAYWLVVTESAFVMNQANKQAFMDAGIRYEVNAVMVMDRRTSPTCRSLNGETFEFANAKVGVNYPPFHPFCRTTVVPIENGNSIQSEDESRYTGSKVSSALNDKNDRLQKDLKPMQRGITNQLGTGIKK